MKEARSERRKTVSSATSSAVPRRPAGCSEIRWSRARVGVPEEGGVDEAGADGVDPDALCRVFEGRRFCEADDAVLGGDIGGGAREAVGAEDRGHVDGAAARRDDGGEFVAHRVEDPAEVGGDDAVPVLDGVLPGGAPGPAMPALFTARWRAPKVSTATAHLLRRRPGR